MYGDYHFYRPQTKFEKAMFLDVSVSHSVHRGYPSMPCRGWYPNIPCRSPGPHPRGKLRGLAWGGIQAHNQGSLQAHTSGDLQAHTQGSLLAHTQGVSRPTPRGKSQHALRQTPPPQQMATAVGGTHPTGMHSCFTRADSTSIFDKLLVALTHVF